MLSNLRDASVSHTDDLSRASNAYLKALKLFEARSLSCWLIISGVVFATMSSTGKTALSYFLPFLLKGAYNTTLLAHLCMDDPTPQLCIKAQQILNLKQ